MNQRKGQPQIFFDRFILESAHAIQIVVLRPPQTVLLTSLPSGQTASLNLPAGQIYNIHPCFAASKMTLFFQKRFVWLARLAAIWF